MVINFFGMRGSGKTTAIRGNLHFCRKPIVIVDILGNFPNPEYIQVTSIEKTILEIEKYHKEKNGPGIICLKTADPSLGVDYLSAALWEINGGTLILDEIDSIDISEAPCFDQNIRYGRNRNIDILTGCRRPAEIHRNVTAAANKFYCFQTHEFRDLDYFRTTLFGDRAEELLRMPKFSGLFMDYDKGMVGKFHIDTAGNIYHDDETTV